jgi:hypothetical protein
VRGNFYLSEGCPGSKDCFNIIDDIPPPDVTSSLGDYGVFYNPAEGKGFVWATVDHTTEFTGGVLIGDVDLDGGVDFIDYAYLAAAWLSDDSPTANWNWECDFDGSGVIDSGDLEILARYWLTGK